MDMGWVTICNGCWMLPSHWFKMKSAIRGSDEIHFEKCPFGHWWLVSECQWYGIIGIGLAGLMETIGDYWRLYSTLKEVFFFHFFPMFFPTEFLDVPLETPPFGSHHSGNIWQILTGTHKRSVSWNAGSCAKSASSAVWPMSYELRLLRTIFYFYEIW